MAERQVVHRTSLGRKLVAWLRELVGWRARIADWVEVTATGLMVHAAYQQRWDAQSIFVWAKPGQPEAFFVLAEQDEYGGERWLYRYRLVPAPAKRSPGRLVRLA